jgi:Endoribonuclease L-PSP
MAAGNLTIAGALPLIIRGCTLLQGTPHKHHPAYTKSKGGGRGGVKSAHTRKHFSSSLTVLFRNIVPLSQRTLTIFSLQSIAIKKSTILKNKTIMTDPRTPVLTSNAPKPLPGIYSQAIVANGFVYCSGSVPMDPVTMKIIDGDIQTHTVSSTACLKIFFTWSQN